MMMAGLKQNGRWSVLRGLLVAALGLAAAAAVATPTLRVGPLPVASVIYPEQDLNVAFDHAAHLEGRGLECLDCHSVARTSNSPTDNLLPQESRCRGCHGKAVRPRGRVSARREAQCETCHPGEGSYIKRSLIPTSRIRFSHALHADHGCERCHTRIVVRAMATVDDLPSMQMCLVCHDGRQAERRCTTCHQTAPDGRLQSRFDNGTLTPPAWMRGAEHTPDWTENHGGRATQSVTLCNACHQQHECLACHDGNIRPRDVHDGAWMSAHAVEARSGDLRCRSCHRGQSFCRTCHLRAGVSWRSPTARLSGTANVVHQATDWAASVAPRHSREARRALQTCVSCHVGQDCVRCHATVNPHGPGFNRRCRALVRAGSQSCIACHSTADGLCD